MRKAVSGSEVARDADLLKGRICKLSDEKCVYKGKLEIIR